MPIKYKVALFLATFLILFLLKPVSSYAAELDHPPVVTSVTGPTTGYYGQTYSFTTAATAADGYTITTLYLQNDGDTFSSKSAGTSGCTGTDCSFTGNFTPPTTGTFIIHAASGYTNGVNSDTCNSYSGDAIMDCQNSGGEYLTFTVLAAPTTPMVESITGPTSGVVGGSYTFSSVVTSIESLPIDGVYVFLEKSDDPEHVHRVSASIDAPSTNCTITSCSVSLTVSPTLAGTYEAFVATNVVGTQTACSSASTAGNLCSYSSGKYITFVVTEDGTGRGSGDEDLPDAGILSNQTKNIFIGLGFITLGILTTQTPKIMNILGLTPEKRRSRFENRFK